VAQLVRRTTLNAAARKSLRSYQVRLIADVCRSEGHALVEQPTGSGKTMQIVTLVAMQLGKRFTHAVIAAPQQQIEHAFVHPDYRLVAFPTCQGVAVPDIEVPEGLILGARNSKQLNSASRLSAYLRHRGPQDYALACTHAALNRLTPERMPDDLSGKALFLDEAHHASADGLSEIVSLWWQRGGQLYFFTATPYRSDGRPVALDGMRLYRRSLAEHMAEGFAPRHLESEIVALGHRGDRITGGIFSGEEALPADYYDETIGKICRRWTEDGRPKAIVRVPPMRGGSGGLVARLIHALASHGARVLNATGTSTEDKKRFLDALEAEKTRSHAESRYDVVVGIQRVMEGTDWPVCAAVYCVGMPGSLNTVVQLLGRAMRLKGEDYPGQHKDRAQLVFFVPCGGGSALADLSIDHSRHALLTCCFLADHEIGQEWIVLREIHRGIEDALGPREQNPTAADAENEASEPLAPEVRGEVELALASAREQIIGEGREPTLGEVVRQAMQARSDLPEGAFRQVATEILAAQPEEGTKVGEAIWQEIARRLRIHPAVKKAMEEAFAAVLVEFRDVTLKDSVVLESMRRQVHGVTGNQMREFAQRLRDAAPRSLTAEMILEWADAHQNRTGEWPVQVSGPIVDAPGETWVNIDAALRIGLRELPGGSSLARLLAEKRGKRNHLDLSPLTVGQILAWADAYHDSSGKWPNIESGSICGDPDETWKSVDGALRQGRRGLPGCSSLPRLLSEQRGVRNHLDLQDLSEEQILAWSDAHHGRTGRWPKKDTGPIDGMHDETWSSVDAALRAGNRGLPGGASLAKLLANKRGVRNHLDLPPLTKKQILTWADAHYERTGDWPKKNAGPIMEMPDETWGRIDRALIQGLRGLSGDSSLSRLLAEHRGARNHLDLPALSIAQVLGWADNHYQRTGTWRRHNSGAVVDAPGLTWTAITLALSKGLRGLPPGSSLAQLLAEYRGVRNHLALPALSEENILSWADAYHKRRGKWPNHKSGLIEGTSGETWGRVNTALEKGLRGLKGGCSLAQLLAQARGVRNFMRLPTLSVEQILSWADAHHNSTGEWPTRNAGAITDAPGETWVGINTALIRGRRGLPGGVSLTQLLEEHRGVPNIQALPRLSATQVLKWADAHRQRTGKWPTSNSGPIDNARGETWQRVDAALILGRRGLPGGSSLARLLAEHRDARNRTNLPNQTVEQILIWADAHFNRTGKWPSVNSGPVIDAPGEKWANIDAGLTKGLRGLPGGSSLARLIKEHRRNSAS
jgi:superfamily II DNA or RNA helicase